MGKKHHGTLAFYGNAILERVWCSDCECNTFVRNGVKVCCGEKHDSRPEKFERMSEPDYHRKIPSRRKQEEILQEQGHCCFYCEQPLDSIKYRKDKPVRLRLHWDHELPYVYSANNSDANFVAACHVCNHIKSSHVFQTVDEAKVWIASRRKEKGYNF